MKIERFEDIIAWQKAKELTCLVYKEFDTSKDLGFKNQIQRASVSIMNNIAEGFERKTNKELEKLSEKSFNEKYMLTEEISKILSGLIKTL